MIVTAGGQIERFFLDASRLTEPLQPDMQQLYGRTKEIIFKLIFNFVGPR